MLKFKYRSVLVWNTMLFIILQYLFLYLQNCLISENSPLSINELIKFGTNNSVFLFYSVFVVYMTYGLKKFSEYLIVILGIFVFIKSVSLMETTLNKLLVINIFVQIVCTYFIFILVKNEKSKAYLNPLYKLNDLFRNSISGIECQTEMRGELVSGKITNLDKEGASLYFERAFEKIMPRINIKFFYEGHEFDIRAKIIVYSENKKSIGIMCINKTKDIKPVEKNWSNFYDNIFEKGFC